MSKQQWQACARAVVLAVSFVALLVVCTYVARAQQPAGAVRQPPPAALRQDATVAQPKAIQGASAVAYILVPPGPMGEGKPWHSIPLRVDGNLAGRVGMLDSMGQHVPARVRVTFVRNAQVVGSARSDETGAFQVPGLRPGVYSLIAVGKDGFGACSIRVLPFAGGNLDPTRPLYGGAALEPPLLEMTLIPLSDYMLATTLISEEAPGVLGQPITLPPAVMTSTPEAVAGGGGGGGGEGFAPLMGLSGLAGLAGLGGGGAGGAPASPSKP